MIYFIPAWYNQDEWKEIEQMWYRRRMKSETDDTVKQIQLFQRNQICDYKILLLSHAPNLRHFLRRQSMFRAPYWSCFDAIQEVTRKKPTVFSFHNLNWPKNIEFIYSPFAVIAMLDGDVYAQIEFGEDGNPIQVDLYKDGQINRRNVYDDRGFISSTIIYDQGEVSYEQYLNEKGVWKICQFADGHVAVNPKNNGFMLEQKGENVPVRYKHMRYDSMEALIEEVFAAYLALTDDEDIFCSALHSRHMHLLNRLLKDKKTIFSSFGDRYSLDGNNEFLRLLTHADYLVADSEKNQKDIESLSAGYHTKIANIPPYDTRVDFGISQQLHVQKVLIPVDYLTEDVFESVILELAAYSRKNEFLRVHLFTRSAVYNRDDELRNYVSGVLENHGYPAALARKENKNKFEFLLDKEDQLPILFVVEQCVDELSVNKCLREQRVLVDLASTPDLFLQISAVSMGVPQIVRTETQYVQPGKNGRINLHVDTLHDDLSFYLDGLANWNNAVIASYEIGKQHTSKSLIARWEEVIKDIERS